MLPGMLRRAVWSTVLCSVALCACGIDPDDCDYLTRSDGPSFVTDDLPAAKAGVPYGAEIEVDLLGLGRNNDYDYRFTIHGELPPGLETRQQGRERWLQIVGVPTAPGSYGFGVTVSIDEPLSRQILWRTMCWTAASKDFRIAVAPPPGGP